MSKTIIHIIGVFLFSFCYTANAETIKTKKWETIDIPFLVKADIRKKNQQNRINKKYPGQDDIVIVRLIK